MHNDNELRWVVLSLMLSALVSLHGCAGGKSNGERDPASTPPAWTLHEGTDGLPVTIGNPLTKKTIYLRTGVYLETGALKLCALYLEGLGDSIANQEPLFRHLSSRGVRTIAFDYPGQGGSEGTMNQTAILNPTRRPNQIAACADQAWKRHAGGCPNAKPLVVGWSTGGIAGYAMAAKGQALGVILFAPALAPHTLIGEAAVHPEWLAALKPVITVETLTHATYASGEDPHVEPIRVDNPFKVPLFASELLSSAAAASLKKVPASVPGLVFLGGDDTYVKSASVEQTVRKRAAHFRLKLLEGARHEIANERPETTSVVYSEITAFLAGL